MQTPLTEITVCGADGAMLLQKALPPGEYILGREPTIELPFEAELVSRRHAKLTLNYDHALIEDLASSNGTFVNGQRVIESTRLWPNQKIQLGAATVELHRVKSVPLPDVSLTSTEAALRRLLPEPLLGQKKYDIGGIVAQGGMGAILNARDAATDRTVAMKVVLDGSSADDLTRFIAEAKVTAQLEHPNIVPVHELSIDENGQPFYTMKFVRGVTLRAILQKREKKDPEMLREYPLPQLLTIFQKVCDAVAFAHSRRVIHRDLKPENVMIGDFGEVLVMDWGLAKVLGRDAPEAAPQSMRSSIHAVQDPAVGSVTLAGTVMGTPQYMSPEQARGEVESLDVRSDICSLGAILYHILALRPPVESSDAWTTVRRVAEGKFDPLLQPGSRIPESLVAVVHKAMALDRDERYASVEALQRDIEAYQNGFATSAENAGLFKQITLLVKRHKGIAATVLAAWLIITGLAVWFVLNVTRERDRAENALLNLRKTAPTFFEQARLLTEQEKFPDALAKIDSALQLVPDDARFHLQRGHVLQSMERFDEAAEAYATTLRLNPKDAIAQANFELSKVLAENKSGHGGALTTAMREKWCDTLQQQGRHAEAIFAGKSLASDARKMLPSWQSKLDAWLGKDAPKIVPLADGYQLNLESRSLSDLSPLQGMPVRVLYIQYNPKIKDLSPLADCPLRHLDVGVDPDISDLSPLRGKDLRSLNISSTKVSTLEVLRGMRNLERLEMNGTNITDLSPIKGARLKVFAAEGNKVHDLGALRGQPLEKVYLGEAKIDSLDPLAEAPVTDLNIEGCGHLNLASLKSRKLRRLAASGTQLDHLEVLSEMTDLEAISLPRNLIDPSPLRKLPHLKNIDTAGYASVGGNWLNLKTADAFWREYDARNAGSRHN